MKKSKSFNINTKDKIITDEKKYLLDILNPTSKNTKY